MFLAPIEPIPTSKQRIHIIRHGQAIHNVQKGYPERDPPLTDKGLSDAAGIKLDFKPDLILCSPMRRTIQTAFAAFSDILQGPEAVPIEIWPDLREARNTICNKGVSRSELKQEFPTLDFSLCMDEWDYEEHSDDSAIRRARRVIEELGKRDEKDIILITHRFFISYLVGLRFANCEIKSYTLPSDLNYDD